MINVIKKCLGKSKIEHHKWDCHPAFVHFGKCKNTFRNGKPLKWYHILKMGDHIETVDTPNDPVSIGTWLLFGIMGVTVPAVGAVAIAGTVGVIAIGLGVAGVVAGGMALFGAFSGGSAGTAAGSSQKQYSSTSQPELTGASNDVSSSIIPIAFGKTRQTPVYGQLPYRTVADGASTNKLNTYFIPNYNNCVYADYKLNDTSINDFSVDYIDIDISYGGSSFIGFDNCKSVDINEQLSYDPDGQVNQSNTWNYNETIGGVEITSYIEVQFQNVDISNFTTKNFKLELDIEYLGTPATIAKTFIINSGDLTLVSGTTYKYNSTAYWEVDVTYLTASRFYPTSYTRGNSTETTNELNCVYVSERIVIGVLGNTETFNQSVNYYQGTTSEIIQTSPVTTTEIDVFISFPQGLYTLTTIGDRINRTSKVQVHYKPDGGSWTPISNATSLYVRGLDGTKNALSSSTTTVGGATITMNSPSDMNVADQLFYRPIGMVLPSGKYSVRVRSADFADKTNYDVGYPYCAEIQYRVTGDVLNTALLPFLNQIKLVATAYKGLSGTLKKFNYIVEAKVPIWNGTDWNTIDKTTNPAAIVRWMLTDTTINARAISLDLIDNDSLVEFYNWAESYGYKASGIISEEIKILEIINEILKNCQTSMIPLLNGKHVFATDKTDKTPTFMFSQHNSWDFKWTPTTGEQVNAIRASFLENDDYTTDELTRYWYNNQANDTPESGKTDDDYIIIKKEYKYVNDRASVLKIVDYELERTQTKRNGFELNCNLEGLNMILLDRGYISNTANMKNESTGLIKDIITSGANITGFLLKSEIEIPTDAKIIIRSLDYNNERSVINIYDVKNSGLSEIVELDTPILNDGIIRGVCEIQGTSDKWNYDGDLFTIGQDTIYDCIVSDIKYNENNTATITAREY